MYCILHCWIARLLSIKLLTSRVPMSFSSREETNRRSRLSGPVGSLKNLPNSTQATSSRLSQRPKRCRRLTIALWFTRIQQLPWSLKCSEICKEGQVFLKMACHFRCRKTIGTPWVSPLKAPISSLISPKAWHQLRGLWAEDRPGEVCGNRKTLQEHMHGQRMKMDVF